ncbi:MAG: RNA polymerase sigma factor [Oscillospiraceae bacterium]
MSEISNDFNRYVEQYQTALSRLCCNLCGNYHDADDLFQETWLRAIRSYEQYDKSKNFGKWLFSICINTYKNNCARAYNKRIVNFSTSDEKDIFLSSVPDKSTQNEEYKELIRIIRELPEKYKIVLALRYFNDYSEKDVSEILKIPVGTVKSRLNKAKTLIKRRFAL